MPLPFSLSRSWPGPSSGAAFPVLGAGGAGPAGPAGHGPHPAGRDGAAVTEAEARAFVAVGEIEPWIAEQRWEAIPGGWRVRERFQGEWQKPGAGCCPSLADRPGWCLAMRAGLTQRAVRLEARASQDEAKTTEPVPVSQGWAAACPRFLPLPPADPGAARDDRGRQHRRRLHAGGHPDRGGAA